MPRRVEDIKISDKRSIRDVPLGSRHERNGGESSRTSSTRGQKDYISRNDTEAEIIQIRRPKISVTPPPEREVRKKTATRKSARMWAAITIAVIAIIAGTAFIASTSYSRATFHLNPVRLDAKIDSVTLIATGTSTADNVKYEIIKYSGTASTSVPAIDGAYVSTKATGNITLYNSHSTSSQRLVAGTRLSNDNGLVYRLPSSVVIPGYTVSRGTILPGSLKTTVVADQAGSAYNQPRTEGTGELRVVAYKDSPRYEGIYARMTSDIKGGYTGTKKTVNSRILASTTKELESALFRALSNQARASVPDGYISFDKAYATSTSAPVIGGDTAKIASLSVTATLHQVVFKKSDLVSKLLGKEKLSVFSGKYDTDGLESLSFVITNPQSWDPVRLNPLIARFSGSLKLTSVVPIEEIKGKLAGQPLSKTTSVLSQYTGIVDTAKTVVELFPSWGNSIPKDHNRIIINVK